MTRTLPSRRPAVFRAFTLIELLVVVSIISLLISILMPSLSRARDQSKSVHCLARLKDFGTGLASYENVNSDLLPPPLWKPNPEEEPELYYGWTETLFAYVWQDRISRPTDDPKPPLPVQRNIYPERYEKYFLCKASSYRGQNSGHFRLYLPAWLMNQVSVGVDDQYDIANTVLDPWQAGSRSAIPPRMPLIGDANELSEQPCTSYIDAGEANTAGTGGHNGNRFSDRHYGGTNYLFQDMHAEWRRASVFRERLSIDVDLNGIDDVEVQDQN